MAVDDSVKEAIESIRSDADDLSWCVFGCMYNNGNNVYFVYIYVCTCTMIFMCVYYELCRCLAAFEGNNCKNPLKVIASGNEEGNAMVENMNQHLTPATAAYGLVRIVSVVEYCSHDHLSSYLLKD